MIERNIKNSSGKITGKSFISEKSIVIDNANKPILKITDNKIIKECLNKDIQIETVIKLYNEYTMSIGEIASLYDRCYSNINKYINQISEIKKNKKGRRNRAYGHPVSKQQSEKMSKALQGKTHTPYERTPEIRKKISDSLKQYFKKHPQDPTPHIKNWEKGVYDNVNFHRGIAGTFTSIKTKKTFRFRSLLELYYALLLEKDSNIITYTFEPFHITMDNGHTYMPDFLLNNSIIVELKSKKFTEKVDGVQEKVQYKKNQCEKYCKKNNLQYKIIYDEDINFESGKMKRYIKNNPNINQKYNIIFELPERIWS